MSNKHRSFRESQRKAAYQKIVWIGHVACSFNEVEANTLVVVFIDALQ